MTKEYSQEEVREMFLDHVRHLIRYWAGEDGSNVETTQSVKDRLSGLTHSIFAAIDGCSTNLPGFALVSQPCEGDKEYLQEKDENWFPENLSVETQCDIAGCLHELLYTKKF